MLKICEEKLKKLEKDMSRCAQSEQESVLQHGIAVHIWTKIMIHSLKTEIPYEDAVLPDWFMLYKDDILKSLLSNEIIKEYTYYHDCGKPYCVITDENGKRHFPNHAQESGKIWRDLGGDEQVARLIEMDMMIHTMKVNDVPEFIKNKEAVTLLIVALSEIHANAELFQGFDSPSFKIKWKKIDRIGKNICQQLWGSK